MLARWAICFACFVLYRSSHTINSYIDFGRVLRVRETEAAYRKERGEQTEDACRDIFNCLPAESVIANRRYKLLRKISASENKLCCLFAATAVKKLLEIRQ